MFSGNWKDLYECRILLHADAVNNLHFVMLTVFSRITLGFCFNIVFVFHDLWHQFYFFHEQRNVDKSTSREIITCIKGVV